MHRTTGIQSQIATLLGVGFLAASPAFVGCSGSAAVDLANPGVDGGAQADGGRVDVRDSGVADGTTGPDATVPDAAVDAAPDARPGSDSGEDDAGTDAPIDAPADAPPSDAGDAGGCHTAQNADGDNDGWSTVQGDCNDCDPNVNPGAIDVLHANPEGGAPIWGDDDCDQVFGTHTSTCDDGLALADVDPDDAAKALDLCQQTTVGAKTWGVIGARYVTASGVPRAPGRQTGLLPNFGANVNTQAGTTMLVLSTGAARTPGQIDVCADDGCTTNTSDIAPVGFPQTVTGCPSPTEINDAVALELTLRAPTNATGFAFSGKFYGFDFPAFVCSAFNDQFVALVAPPVNGAVNGNVAFGANGGIGVNSPLMTVCDPAGIGTFASNCLPPCPTAPDPYCPMGPSELVGTGFGSGEIDTPGAGATPWFRTQSPITGGSTFTVRFAIWDGGDALLDSTIVLDHFEWITEGAPAAPSTGLLASPR